MHQHRWILNSLYLVKKSRQVVYYVIYFIWYSGKAKVVTGNRPGVARASGLEEEMITKGHEKQFGGGRSVLCVDFGDGYMAESMYTNIWDCTPKRMNLTL